jgi:hypothetical protein
MPVRFAELRRAWLSAAALCLRACTGAGLEPPGEKGGVAGPFGDPGGPGSAAGGTDGAGVADAGAAPPALGQPDDDAHGQREDAGSELRDGGGDDGGDPDLDAGAP